MPMETGPFLSDAPAAFTARLDALHPDQNAEDLSSALRAAFQRRDLFDSYVFSSVGGTERAKALLEVFDKALQAATHDVTIFKQFRRLCGRAGLLPASHIIPKKLIKTTEHPIASGGFGDVWEGIYGDDRVAIKAIRVYKDEDVEKVRKVFCKEVAMWKRLAHPNIVPLLGVSEGPAPLSMVSEWMPNGNVRDYVNRNPETSRLHLLLDVSRGLSYLHSLEIVHGDLKGENILVDKSGCARLNDFGFTSIASLNCTETSAPGFKGSHRWMAPELFDINGEGKSGLSTRESDMFALGMVTFEVFTGQVPFPESKASALVMKRITDGERPSRPSRGEKLGLSNELWEVIQSSLAQEAEERCPVSRFIKFLEKATPDTAVLKALTEFDANNERHITKLRQMFGCGDNTLLGMREEETLTLIEVFDRVLSSSLGDSKLRSRCLYGLQKVSARCGILPKSYWIAHSTSAEPDDIASATRRASSTRQRLIDGKLVAVKTIGPDCIDNFNTFKYKLCTNAVLWKRLRHPNVVNFLGLGSDAPPFSLVYPWMPNGSLSEYLRGHPNVDKLGLLLDIAQGLAYLHQYNLVHGNLTGHNVLVDNDGAACISEYGLEAVLRDKTSSKSIPTNVRWMAPEVLGAEGRRVPSGDAGKAADIYSLAMVMFEVLSGTTPFPKESDEEIVGGVNIGLRPEWSPNGPIQKSVDELIEACWNQEPKERPTASSVLQTLLALGEEKPQAPMEPLKLPVDDTWDYLEDAPEFTPSDPKGYKEHSILSGSTLVNSSVGRLFTHSGSASKHGSSGGRRAKVKKHMRHLLHLSKHESTAEEAAEKRDPEVAIVDQREEIASISGDSSIPYLTSGPIPGGKKLKKVVITIVSKDQGWSSYQNDHGTYRNSWTWFELSVGAPSKDSGEKWRGEVVRNLHAHDDFKKHTVEIMDEELYKKAESGDVLTVWAHAQYQGWKNTVKKVKIRYIVE